MNFHFRWSSIVYIAVTAYGTGIQYDRAYINIINIIQLTSNVSNTKTMISLSIKTWQIWRLEFSICSWIFSQATASFYLSRRIITGKSLVPLCLNAIFLVVFYVRILFLTSKICNLLQYGSNGSTITRFSVHSIFIVYHQCEICFAFFEFMFMYQCLVSLT